MSTLNNMLYYVILDCSMLNMTDGCRITVAINPSQHLTIHYITSS